MIRRFFLCSLLLAAVLAGVGAATQTQSVDAWKGLIKHWFSSDSQSNQALRFRLDLVDRLNHTRLSVKQPQLLVDPELETWLEQHFAGMNTDELDHVTEKIQEAMPRYYRLSICTASGASLRQLLDEFQDYARKVPSTMTHLAIGMRPTAGGLGQQALLVVGQRLLNFTPELLTGTSAEAYFNRCPHCQHPHVVRIAGQQRSLGLECPQCRRTYAVVAADTQGSFRYVNEYLTGYAPPAIFSKDQSRVHELFTIWSAVHTNCVYTLDSADKRNQTDSWQTSLETQRRGKGDCEDSAIFLCDWLLSRGFQARVALGKYGDMGGHAWCVVKLDDKEYLLESTEGRPDISNPPLVSHVGSRYVPEILFDRFAIYVRNRPGEAWKGDYWSPKVWLRTDPRAMNPTAGRARVAEAVQTDPSKMAKTVEANAAAAPYLDISSIPVGDHIWRIPLPGTPGLLPAPAPAKKE